jgi:hypothetical protein
MLRIRSSKCSALFSGPIGGLTPKQKETLSDYLSKIQLTVKQAEERDRLQQKEKDANELPEGAKTLIQEIIDEKMYEYHVELDKRELEKGWAVEEQSIERYNRLFFTDYKKLEDGDMYASLEYGISKGHPDVVDERDMLVLDVKSSWNKKTFTKTIEKATKKVKESGYDWQVKHYLYMLRKMTGKDWRNGVVAFVLCSTPEELVPEWEGDQLHYVDHLPDNMLVTRVMLTLTDEEIEFMEARLESAEKYANEYIKYLKNKNL